MWFWRINKYVTNIKMYLFVQLESLIILQTAIRFLVVESDLSSILLISNLIYDYAIITNTVPINKSTMARYLLFIIPCYIYEPQYSGNLIIVFFFFMVNYPDNKI